MQQCIFFLLQRKAGRIPAYGGAYEQNYNQTETVRLSAAVPLPAYAAAAGHSRRCAGFLCCASCMVSGFRLQHYLRERRTQRLRLRISAVRRRIYRLDLSLHRSKLAGFAEHAAKGRNRPDGRRILRRGPCPDHAVFRSADGQGKILPVCKSCRGRHFRIRFDHPERQAHRHAVRKYRDHAVLRMGDAPRSAHRACDHHQRRGRSRQDRQPRNRRFYLGRESPVAGIRPVRDHLVRQLGCLLRDQQKPSRSQGSAR